MILYGCLLSLIFLLISHAVHVPWTTRRGFHQLVDAKVGVGRDVAKEGQVQAASVAASNAKGHDERPKSLDVTSRVQL